MYFPHPERASLLRMLRYLLSFVQSRMPAHGREGQPPGGSCRPCGQRLLVQTVEWWADAAREPHDLEGREDSDNWP